MKKQAGQVAEVKYMQVVQRVKAMIAQGLYRKGDLLPSEKELMEQTGVSRITVREALRVLAELGVIQTQKGKGSYVLVDSTDPDADRIFGGMVAEHKSNFITSAQIRYLLEPEIAREAALNADDALCEALEHCLRGHQTPEPEPAQALDDFHRIIVKALGNDELLAIFDNLTALETASAPASIVLPESQERVLAVIFEQHQKIYEAIRERNGEFAYFYMKEHTAYLQKIYNEYFQLLALN